jgi:hypothetical protein
MRKQCIALTILLVLLSSSSCILLRSIPPVKATYVEGTISQDTVWFLAESPFVLSGNVTVAPGVTLTIEPGVQVRFGGPFSLNINGGIVANGTSEKKILFTTNDPTHGINWQTIAISGTQPSSFVNCEVEHGTDGITVDNGYVEVRNSSVRFTSQNGLLVNDGSVLAADNDFHSNNSTAVHIVGGAQITITSNTIESNQNGIVLGGHLPGAINIVENSIFNNTNSGITLQADLYSNTIITRNTVSANGNGFLVQTNASTNIFHNYILNNTVGIFYQDGYDHQAHFNDLCNNEVGIDISSRIAVDATYNYWGDRSGPFHPSLNPHGKGNPVGGDGTDLDFIFFLSLPSDHINQKPTANLWTDKALAAPNQNIMFIGTDSQDEGRIDQYLFDFGDGTSTNWITLSLFNHTYSFTGTYTASLTVTDDFNTASENSAIASVTIQDLTPLRATLNPSSETTVYNGNVSLTVYASDDYGPVENAAVVFFSLKGGTFSQIFGQTNSTGCFETTFTAPNVTELANIGLIARVSKNGYADGSDFKYLKVLPPLDVQISPEPTIVNSEGNSTVTIYIVDTSGTPVPEAYVSLSPSNGTLSAGTGTTDVNGAATFVFTAPLTLEPINITLSATANKTDYATGTSQNIIAIQPKLLNLELTAAPASIFSQESSTITIRATHDFAPIPDAKVTMSSDVGGNFSAEEATTDSNGISQFIFTAPQTTLLEGINATLTAKAAKSGYAESEFSLIVPVKPKVLSTQILLPSNTTFSEAKINLTVSVKYGTTRVQNASINLTMQAGDFSAATGTTDSDGNLTLEFTAPQVSHSTNITITAVATKAGYAGSQSEKTIAVSPRTFSILIISPMISSGETADIRVQVTCPEDGNRVGDAHVVFSLSTGDLVSSTTDANGTCYFTLTSRQTSAQVLNMTANATKNGYTPGQQTSSVIIIQPESGFPFLTIMMIMVPIVIVVVIAVLIKLKVMVVSAEEAS